VRREIEGCGVACCSKVSLPAPLNSSSFTILIRQFFIPSRIGLRLGFGRIVGSCQLPFENNIQLYTILFFIKEIFYKSVGNIFTFYNVQT
jgi:hypothetical protein